MKTEMKHVKLFIILKIFSIIYFFISLITIDNGDFLMPKRVLEIIENVKSLTSKSLLETIKNGTKRGKILNGNITYTFSSFK